ALRLSPIAHPTTFRLHRSMTAARYSQPSPVGTYVMSAAQARSGSAWSKHRPSTLGAIGWAWDESVVRTRNRRRTTDRMPRARISRATVFSQHATSFAFSAWYTRGLP